jgi:hypothetical protein
MSITGLLRRRWAPLVLACAALMAATTLLQGASTGFWVVATQADFLKGDADAVSIDTDGRVTIAPALQMLGEVGTPAVWRAAAGAKGVVYAATGHDGKLWAFGGGAAPKVIFDAAELDLQAIAVTAQGAILVGSAPDGKVYRVSPEGASSTFFDPEDKYIWAIAVARDGAVYVGTGSKGKVYKVPAGGGAGTLVYDAGAEHVSALAFDAAGQLLVGTSSPGRVVRVAADGKPFVILEAAYQEVRSLRVAGAVAYATAAGASAASAPAETTPRPSPETTAAVTLSTEVTVVAGGDATTVTSTPAATGSVSGSTGSQKGAIYRIDADGDWTTFWESPEDTPYDVLVERAGTLLVATGSKGKLYRLSGDPVLATLVARADAQQITALADDGTGLVLAASNPGRVLRLSAAPAATGTYLSDVRDTTTVATWGTIRWEATLPAGTGIALHTRSGNTRTPDATWSAWSQAYTSSEGSRIESPKARFLQWKAVLTSANGVSPTLTSVAAAYLPRNTRPSVDSVTVHPPGVVFQRPFPTGDPELAGVDGVPEPRAVAPGTPTIGQTLGRRTYQKSLQTFVWQARDADGDRLQYSLAYRREGDRTWTTLKGDLADDVFTWDTTTVPDGTYVLKVTASDASANAPALALAGERESQSFEIDNTPPAVDVAQGAGADSAPRASGAARAPADTGAGRASTIRFTIRDGHSPVQRVEYASAGDRWRQAYPVDGLLDSREERFELTLEAGARSPVVVRATDALGNVATAVLR